MSSPDSPDTPTLEVTCLCAQWCGTCKDYAALFASLQQVFPRVAFQWIDIEDESDRVDPIEVDNFPSILIARQGRAHFFGSITPHLETLRRLIQAHLEDNSASSHPDAEVQALAARLRITACP
jgi:thiol-disulfide isomerase/thioredoxin